MLKKFAHISLIVLLMLATTGVTVFKHYCGNTLVSKSIGLEKDGCCGGKHCKNCHSDIKNFKVSDDFESYQSDIDFKHTVSKSLDSFASAVILGLTYSFSPSAVYLIYHRTYVEPPLYAQDQCARLQVYRL